MTSILHIKKSTCHHFNTRNMPKKKPYYLDSVDKLLTVYGLLQKRKVGLILNDQRLLEFISYGDNITLFRILQD